MSLTSQLMESEVVGELTSVNLRGQVRVEAEVRQWTEVCVLVTGHLKEWNLLLNLNIVGPFGMISWHPSSVGNHGLDWLCFVVFGQKGDSCGSSFRESSNLNISVLLFSFWKSGFLSINEIQENFGDRRDTIFSILNSNNIIAKIVSVSLTFWDIIPPDTLLGSFASF